MVTLKVKVISEINFNTVLLNQYVQNIITSTCNHYKVTNEIFYTLFFIPSLENSGYFTMKAHLNLN